MVKDPSGFRCVAAPVSPGIAANVLMASPSSMKSRRFGRKLVLRGTSFADMGEPSIECVGIGAGLGCGPLRLRHAGAASGPFRPVGSTVGQRRNGKLSRTPANQGTRLRRRRGRTSVSFPGSSAGHGPKRRHTLIWRASPGTAFDTRSTAPRDAASARGFRPDPCVRAPRGRAVAARDGGSCAIVVPEGNLSRPAEHTSICWLAALEWF